MAKGSEYVISVGSNLPTGQEIVRKGLSFLESLLSAAKKSSIYTTPSISRGDDSFYCNAVIAGESVLTSDEMVAVCKEWEKSVGRRHIPGSTEVAGDMDIVIVDGIVVRPKDYERDYFKIGFNQIHMAEKRLARED